MHQVFFDITRRFVVLMGNFSDVRELFLYIGNSLRDISSNVFDIQSLFSEFGNVLPDIREVFSDVHSVRIVLTDV